MSVEATLLVLRGAAAVLGAAFVYVTIRAYVKTRSTAMLTLAIATILLAAGAVAEGFALRGLGMTIDQAHVFESVVWLIAFAILLTSVLVPERVRR